MCSCCVNSSSKRARSSHFALLWTSDIPLFIAQRYVDTTSSSLTSSKTHSSTKSIRDLQKDIEDQVNQVIRTTVRPHLGKLDIRSGHKSDQVGMHVDDSHNLSCHDESRSCVSSLHLYAHIRCCLYISH